MLWDVDPYALPHKECPKDCGLVGCNRRVECIEVKKFSMNENRRKMLKLKFIDSGQMALYQRERESLLLCI